MSNEHSSSLDKEELIYSSFQRVPTDANMALSTGQMALIQNIKVDIAEELINTQLDPNNLEANKLHIANLQGQLSILTHLQTLSLNDEVNNNA